MPTKLHDDFKQHKQRGSSILVKKVLSEDQKNFFPGCTEKVMNKSGGKNAFQKWPRTSFVLYHKTAMRRGKMVADGRWQNSVNFNCRSSNGHATAGIEDNAHLCTMYAKCPWESFLMARGTQKRRLARSIFGPWTAHKLLCLCGKISFHLFFFNYVGHMQNLGNTLSRCNNNTHFRIPLRLRRS